jgi:hypothetical protein
MPTEPQARSAPSVPAAGSNQVSNILVLLEYSGADEGTVQGSGSPSWRVNPLD